MNNKSIPIIYFFLLLFTNIYYAYSWPGKLPEIAFQPYDKRQDNLLSIELLHHDITLTTNIFYITSTWTIRFDNETADLGELIVKSDRPDAELSYISVNNTEIKPIPIENKKNYYLLQLPNNSNNSFYAKLTLKYKIGEKSNFQLAFFTARDLFHIAKIVKDKNNQPGYDLRERSNMDFSEIIKTYAHDYWFSLALGIIYDREINKQLTGNYPHIIEYMVDTWKNHYKNRPDIDQKLIHPDLSNDKQAGINSFHRTQFFAHGKGFYVLNKIREVIGRKIFDQEVAKYLNYGLKNNDGYVSFRKQPLEYFEELPQLEAQLEIL